MARALQRCDKLLHQGLLPPQAIRKPVLRRPVGDRDVKTAHYLSIYTQQGGHLDFFVTLADDRAEAGSKDERFVIKLQSKNPSGRPQAGMLRSLEQEGRPLLWRVEKDRVELLCGGWNIGSIRNEYLTLLGHSLALNDLTGTI